MKIYVQTPVGISEKELTVQERQDMADFGHRPAKEEIEKENWPGYPGVAQKVEALAGIHNLT